MPRPRLIDAGPGGEDAGSPVLRAAERMVVQISRLMSDMSALRADNATLRAELKDALALFQGASAALASGHASPASNGTRIVGRRRRGRKPKTTAKGRATPPEVTGEVVRAVLAKLGEATAAQVAAEITGAGAPVSGRAVRFLAERAGAQTVTGEDGQRRYRL